MFFDKFKLSLTFFLILAFFPFVFSISDLCVIDSDCQKYNHCENNICKHNDLIPITIFEVIGLLSIFIASATSNAGGIGGGTLFLPVLLLIMNFYGHEAIPLSKIVIFTGSLASFILNLKIKHPKRNSKALDFNLIIIICPNLLFGTMLGVTLNRILPNSIIIFLLTILLVYNTYTTFKSFKKQYNEELKERSLATLTIKDIESRRENSIHNNNKINNKDINKENTLEYEEYEIQKELKKDQIFLRWDKLKFVIIPFLIMVILALIRESKLVHKCSFSYWFLFIAFFFIAVIADYLSFVHIRNEFNFRQSINFPYDSKDISWNPSKIIGIAGLGLISGFIAGTIGIGGGVVLGPILLSIGIHPIVSTVTTNFLVLLTSSSTSFQFILQGMLNYQYAIVSIIFSSLGSLTGTIIVHKYMRKSGRQSIIILALLIVIGLSAFLLPISSIESIIYDIKGGRDLFKFNNLCNDNF